MDLRYASLAYSRKSKVIYKHFKVSKWYEMLFLELLVKLIVQ